MTVHDLIPVVYPDHFPRGLRGEIKWQIQKNVLKHTAKNIITDSHASKLDIERLLGFPADQVFVVQLAPRAVFKPVTSSEIRKKYTLNNKYVLYVGDINWNKNIPALLDSVHNVELVCVGKAFADYPARKKNVTFLGFVPDEDLAELYSMAEALVYPSFAEGFGFPVLEAMACGCPVVTSTVSSLVEIAGPAIMVNPYKTEDIQRGTDRILALSKEKRQELIQKGFEWVKKFTWKNVARQTIFVYENVLDRK